MKLQNMTVIFIIIMIPIIIVTSYYIGLQIKTITMQKNYTVKLQTAAKDSIQALEINTVEWNSASSNLADSKRRDVLAAINTFTTSLANGMGIGGAGKGRIQTYIPAIVYTMYDGYYIYSASLMKDQDTIEKDQNGKDVNYGRTQFDNNKIKYKETSSYQYILKPYSPYSARYVKGEDVNVTVNYTLDNYIRVYGTINGEYQTKEGYLVVCSDEGVKGVTSGSISGIEYRGAEIKPEKLKENVYADGKVGEYSYIYDQYDNKLYWDKDKDNYFSVDKYNNKVYLQDALPEGDAGFSITNRFRKISIPMLESEWTVQKVFQILNPGGDSKFYYENESGAFVEFTAGNVLGNVNKNEDYSAINYCVESYVFTQWVTKNLGNITVDNMISTTEGQYNNVESEKYIFRINESNNPDPENDTAYANSVLAQHKKDIIINTIEKNLSQATAQAQEMNPNYEYRLPQLSYDEWEQALSNISIIAFMQGMPIGLKYYNNYAIATSTLNKEFVDPDELYFAGTGDQYYHQRQCEQATGSDYVGYRSIDYVAKSYEEVENDTTKSTKYYYPHANSTNSELECYYCLVNRSTYNDNGNWKGDLYRNWTDSYYNALARERYMQLDEPGTYKPNVTVEKKAETTSVEYGGTVKYTITIKNNGIVADTITLVDAWKYGEIELTGDPIVVKSDKRGKLEVEIKPVGNNTRIVGDDTGIGAERIYIEANETITVTYDAYLKGSLGKTIENTAILYSFTNKDIELDKDTATTTVKKTIKVAKTEKIQNCNVVIILDHSFSLRDSIKDMYDGVATFLSNDYAGKIFNNNGSSMLSAIHFNKSATVRFKRQTDIGKAYNFYTGKLRDAAVGGTSYTKALNKAIIEFQYMKNENPNNKNVLVFFTDGAPTGLQDGTSYTIDKNGIYSKWGALWFVPGKPWTDDARDVWREIKKLRQDIINMKTEIYCINFGNEEENKNAEYGLKEIISSYKETGKSQYYANVKKPIDVKDAFASIGDQVANREMNLPSKYETTEYKLAVQYANEITSITIGKADYTVEEAKSQGILVIEGEEGYIDLSKLSEGQLVSEITVKY